MTAPIVAALLGVAAIVWAAGFRMLDPGEIGWVMHGDWQIHFLGWQFFRHEPWHWPPGALRGFLEPIGTSLGYTDSIPLVAFALKPFASVLPNPLQYLWVWFLLCFALQGFFGALVVSTWTRHVALQVLGGALFVLFPTLVSRIAHPALCAHWLILWALWLNWRSDAPARMALGQHVTLGVTAGLVHPYLAVMALALLAARAARLWLIDHLRFARAMAPMGAALLAVVAGWWTSGLLSFAAAGDVAAESGRFSMNLLAIVNPGPRAYFLPGIKVVSLDQFGEGFQYFGAGVLLLGIAAVAVAVVRRVRPGRSALPLICVLAACALYSVLPQVAVGTRVLLDLTDSVGGLVSIFRSTGRFFWPVGYAVLAVAIGVVVRHAGTRTAAALLTAALVVQLVDLHRWWLEMHNGSRTSEFFAWDMPLKSHEWDELLPRYRHMRLYFPEFCRGAAAAPTAPAAYLASLHGLTINDGFAARVLPERQVAACRTFGDDFSRGFLDDRTVYLLHPSLLPDFVGRLGNAVECRTIDDVSVCTSRGSLSTRVRDRGAEVPGS